MICAFERSLLHWMLLMFSLKNTLRVGTQGKGTVGNMLRVAISLRMMHVQDHLLHRHHFQGPKHGLRLYEILVCYCSKAIHGDNNLCFSLKFCLVAVVAHFFFFILKSSFLLINVKMS
ncbi:unnamed protein product [Ilex paraguariensis]|uniref:Secreted protein n=1 Tax=Ilex paraguariensis TaxID=185542 RepID=A0ABC8T820_9AQUA